VAALPVVRILGAGRAGRALATTLRRRGLEVDGPHDRTAVAALVAGTRPVDPVDAVDVVVLAVPDGAIAGLAAGLAPDPDVVVVHLAGSLGLDVLAPHPRRGALHPLVAIPAGDRGADALAGAWCAVAGDPVVDDLVAALGGRSFTVADADRARYHAAACVAANHVVAVLGQAARLAAGVGAPPEALWALAAGAVADVAALGPAAALTGPVARGDWATVARHLAALPADERDGYLAGARLADRLARPAGPPAPELADP
jgi:predicted short-subunit dehydrogenase-like oxidoreductase (DUF2520 family)